MSWRAFFASFALLLGAVAVARAGQSVHPAVRGDWQGQVQFLILDRERRPVAHAVAATVLRVQDDFAVLAAIKDAGCELRGLVLPEPLAGGNQIVKLDVVASNCRESAFNQHYRGRFQLDIRNDTVEMDLRGSAPGLELKGMLSRR